MNKKKIQLASLKTANYFQIESQGYIFHSNTKMQSKTINGGAFLRNLRKRKRQVLYLVICFQVLRYTESFQYYRHKNIVTQPLPKSIMERASSKY